MDSAMVTKTAWEDKGSMRTYYLPDGTQVRDYPKLITFEKLVNGKKKEGIRDGNLDKGWLMEPPQVIKPKCSICGVFGCTTEHSAPLMTHEEIAAKRGKAMRREAIPEDTSPRLAALEQSMEELKQMMVKLLGGK